MSRSHSTFIVGGAFRIKNGKRLVQKRSWEMLRIFSDHMANPIFGMLRNQDDETFEYPLPDSVRILEIPSFHGKAKLINMALGRGLTPEIEETVDACCAVYLRQPLWECFDVFRSARARGKKTLVSYHGDWPDALRKSEASMLQRPFNLCMAAFIHHHFMAMAKRSEAVFCVGEALHERYGRFARKSVVFANFLHSTRDIAEPRPLKTAPPYRILFVGGFEEYKGIRYLIRAAALLKKQGIDFILTLVGKGSLEQQLRDLSKTERIADSVEWRGYVQHGPELMDVYRQADVFVLPSIASEGTAKVLMEAMSQGVPVVATDVGNTKRMLGNGEYGVVIRPADASALAAAIHAMLNNAERRSLYVKKGIILARQSTKEKQAAIVGALLRSAVPECIGVPQYLASLNETPILRRGSE